MLANSLSTTGAFEVTLGNKLIYSGIANGGKVPTNEYLARLLEEAGLVAI